MPLQKPRVITHFLILWQENALAPSLGSLSLLKIEAVVNHMLSRWHRMMDQNLRVIISVHNFINFDKIFNSDSCNAALNHDSTMFSSVLYSPDLIQTFLMILTKIFNFDSSLHETCCQLLCSLHTSAFSPCFSFLRMASWQPDWDHFWWGFRKVDASTEVPDQFLRSCVKSLANIYFWLFLN